MNNFEDLFKEYEKLAGMADRAFNEAREEHGECFRCREGCDDCCHSVFGLFLIESVYLSRHFARLDRRLRREAAARAEKAERDLREMEKRLAAYDHDPRIKGLAMARERVRCPLLDGGGKCVLYPFRPVTCRVYGMPAVIGGQVRACWKAGFENGREYQAFDLDKAYRELFGLSKGLLERAGRADPERASLLFSVPRSISAPLDELLDLGQNP